MKKTIIVEICDICNKEAETEKISIIVMSHHSPCRYKTHEPSEHTLDVCRDCEKLYLPIWYEYLEKLANEFKRLTNHRY